MRAYVDESVRENTPGLYVLAAVVVASDQADAVRSELQSQLPARQTRFHWHDEGELLRGHMTKVVGALQLLSVVAVAAPMGRRRQERARALCLKRLLWELHELDVDDVLLESRRQRDRHDRSLIGQAMRAGSAPSGLRYAFGQPDQEPLLWLPDLVAGAVAEARAGTSVQYLGTLGATVSVVDVGSPG